MTRSKQLQFPFQLQLPFHFKFPFQFHLQLICLLFALLWPALSALPQDFFLDEVQLEQTPSSPAFSDPSDLSAGLNFLPVGNLIAAAANPEPPAPVQFVRIAMNSGL